MPCSTWMCDDTEWMFPNSTARAFIARRQYHCAYPGRETAGQNDLWSES